MEKQYNFNPLSSASDRFAVEEKFMIFRHGQVVKLTYPAHAYDPDPNSTTPTTSLITVTAQKSDTDSASVTEISVPFSVCDRSGSIGADDQDVTQVKSEMMAQENGSGLDPHIARYIKVDSYGTEGLEGKHLITVKYQAAVKGVEDDQSIYDGTEFSNLPYSPSLMNNVLKRLTVLENATTMGSLFGTSLGTTDILDEDLTGIAPENYVRYERHEVNTPAGIVLVQPSKGSFYPNNLEVLEYTPENFILSEDTKADALGNIFFWSDSEHILNSANHVSYQHRKVLSSTSVIEKLLEKATDRVIKGGIIYLKGNAAKGITAVTPLVYGVDYTVDSIDIPRTARSTSMNAVYQNIRFITQRNGEVLISYQAFGGFAAPEDIRSIHQETTNIKKLLTNSGLVTENSLESQPFLQSIYKRLTRIEEYYNCNSQVEHRIGITKSGWHWINIAIVYDKAWETATPNIHDVGTFRVQSSIRGWMYEFSVDVDMSRKTADVMKIRTIGTNQGSECDYTDYSRILFRDNLAARLCWIKNGNESGLVLQIGWDFTPYLRTAYRIAQETILVTNKSDASSLWTLLTDPDVVNFPSNGVISVYQHSRFKVTEDTEFVDGKVYWFYKDLYLYRRTADRTIKEGKTYFERDASGTTYYQVDTTSEAYAPGNSMSLYMDDVLDEDGNVVGKQVQLFERIMYGRYPVQAYPVMTTEEAQREGISRYIPALSPVTRGMYYEQTDATYDADNTFSMPNGDMWTYGVKDNNCCTKLIEPNGGVVAWLGNVNLTPYAYGEAACCQCEGQRYNSADHENYEDQPEYEVAKYTPNPYTSELMFNGYVQTLLDPASVSKVTLVLFDRLNGEYVTVDGNVSSFSDGTVGGEVVVNLEDLCFCKFVLSKITLISDSESTVANGEAKRGDYRQEYQTRSTVLNGTSTYVDRFLSEQISTEYADVDSSISSLAKISLEPFFGKLSRDTERFDLRQIRLHF